MPDSLIPLDSSQIKNHSGLVSYLKSISSAEQDRLVQNYSQVHFPVTVIILSLLKLHSNKELTENVIHFIKLFSTIRVQFKENTLKKLRLMLI